MKHRIKQYIRSWVMSFACGWLNRVSLIWLDDDTHDYFPVDENGARIIDHLRWQLERPFEWLFGVAWNGSDEEIRMVYTGELAPSQMSERQLAELFKYDLAEITVSCTCCEWFGAVSDLEGEDYGSCPWCNESDYISLDPFEVKTVTTFTYPLLLTERRAASHEGS